MFSNVIYLDNNASTRPDPTVLDAMLRQASEGYGNPSGQHVRAAAAADAVTSARRAVAALADVSPNRVFFTSGATEANNTVFAHLPAAPPRRSRLLVSPIEHKSVLESAHAQEAKGYRVEYLPVSDGSVDVQRAQGIFADDVAVVAVMFANNETGHLQPITELAALSREVGAHFHCDATQGLGKIPLSLSDLDVDSAAFSAHKLHGPMGIGGLYIRRGLSLPPLLRGGGQQAGMRAGTENVPAIVGFGVAADLARTSLAEAEETCRDHVRLLQTLLHEGLPALQVLSSESGLPNTLLVRIPDADAEQVLAHCHGVAASTGSACATLSPDPSHVLLALFGDERLARECLRLSVSRYTTHNEIVSAAHQLIAAARRVHELRATA